LRARPRPGLTARRHDATAHNQCNRNGGPCEASTPLAQKRGTVSGSHVLLRVAPEGHAGLLAPLAAHRVEPMQALKLVVRKTLR
jgi:hypothetical protein